MFTEILQLMNFMNIKYPTRHLNRPSCVVQQLAYYIVHRTITSQRRFVNGLRLLRVAIDDATKRGQ